MILIENKRSYFALSVKLPVISTIYHNQIKEKVEKESDLILGKINASPNIFKFESNKDDEIKIIYLFSTLQRKRKGQLLNLCEKHFDKNGIDYEVNSFTKPDFRESIQNLKKSKSFQTIESQEHEYEYEYEGSDLKVFKERKNWYPWQEELYEKLFREDNSFQEAHPRHIISIIDKKGNCGKSSFFKWLFFKHPNEIGRIGYGTASQLRSSVINIGKKKLYIIDLPRSKSRSDHQEDLVSVLEDLKTGFVSDAMSRGGKTLIMEPPHIIIFSNYLFNQSLLSKDRWKTYKITSNYQLKEITDKI